MYKFSKPLDTNNYPPLSSPRLNIEGSFVFQMKNQEKVTARNGNQFIEIEFVVDIGPHKGQHHCEQFYVFHDDADKRAFSLRILASVYRALNGGSDGKYDGSESIGKLVMVDRQQDGEYEGRPNYNSRNWRPAPSVDVSTQAGASASAQPVQSAAAPAAGALQGVKQAVEELEAVADDLDAEDVPWD